MPKSLSEPLTTARNLLLTLSTLYNICFCRLSRISSSNSVIAKTWSLALCARAAMQAV